VAQLQRLAIAPTQITGSQLRLTPEQQHYLYRVLRLTSGDGFIALNGVGQSWRCQLSADPDLAELGEPICLAAELAIAITLLVAIPKGSGMDEVVRQVTEIGVAEVVPILSDRTVLNPSSNRVERWRRIAQEAAEQSERQIVPLIHAPVQWQDGLTQWNAHTATCFLCAERDRSLPLLTALQNLKPPPQLVIAIGPEGGWTPGEIQGAIAVGYQPVSLGNRILRAVTASVVAAAVIASVFEGVSASTANL
jgi:16S rRNA (uracil1498-N3)-methyltransferase